MGNLVLMNTFHVDKNQLTGSLPREVGNMKQTLEFRVSDNSLTGSLPDIFHEFDGLESIVLSMNKFTGRIPHSLWRLNQTKVVPINGNELTGTVPDNFCDIKDVVNVDDSPWFRDESKVFCSCCGDESCYMWDISLPSVAGTVRPECPKENVQTIVFFEDYWFTDLIANESLFELDDFKKTIKKQLCVSPTGCYTFLDDENGPAVNYGYSADSKSLEIRDECDTVEICGEIFPQNHPKRKGLNHLTQLVVQDFANLDPDSTIHQALCWILVDDVLFNTYDICDGTLLQRFVMGYFFYKHADEVKEFLDFDIDVFSQLHTCEWAGITCDESNKFVEHFVFNSSNLKGTLITEIGFLTRLKTINLRGNAFHGTINPSMFSHMPFLENFDVAENRFSGNLPNELFVQKRMQRIDLSDNVFAGHFPNDIVYSTELREYRALINLCE